MQATSRALSSWVAALFALAGLCGARDAAALDFEFTQGTVRYGEGWKGYGGAWIDVGDVDHDGLDDMSVVLLDPPPYPPGSVVQFRRAYVHLQRDRGTLAPPIVLSMPMQSINTVEAVDLDGDGRNELVAGYDGGLLVYRWNGTALVPTTTPASFDCRYVVTGDIDGNGTRDIVCSAESAQVITLFRVDLDGTVSEPGYMQVITSGDRQFKLEDVTGDGRPDLLQGDAGLWSFLVYANDGAGGFQHARAYAWPRDVWAGFTASGIEAFDVDGDGANEVVVPRRCYDVCSNLFVWRRDSAGTLRLWRQIPTADLAASLQKHDVDGDGYLDLLVNHNQSLGRYMGGPSGLSQTELRSGAWLGGFALGDLNGDARTDVAFLAGGWQAELKYGIGKRQGDVTGNYQSDLVWRDASSGRTSVWPHTQGLSSQQLPVVVAPWTIRAIADFNGDDAADLFWRNPSNGANMIWLGADATKTRDVAPLAAQWLLAGSGDFDGDLQDDVLWRHATTGANRIWFGGSAAASADISAVPDLAWQVVGIGDFDGDHRDDVLWRHMANGSNAVWFSANASTSATLARVQSLAWKVAGVGDFNRDGVDDVIWRNGTTGAQSLWHSANAAHQQVVTPVGDPGWQIVAVGDYQRDGVADLVWRHSTSGNTLIWHDASSASLKQELVGIVGTHWKVVP